MKLWFMAVLLAALAVPGFAAAVEDDDKHVMRVVVGDSGQLIFTVGGRPVSICNPGVKTARLTKFRCFIDRKTGEACPDRNTIVGIQCGPGQ